MKQNIVLILLICFTQFSLSQNSKHKDTIFFNNEWKETTKNNALYYRLLSRVKSNKTWQLKDYYADTNTLQALAFSKDSTENQLHGKIEWFRKNGEIITERYYFNGNEVTKDQYKLQHINEKYDIDLLDDEKLLTHKEAFITNDTITDHILISKTNTGTKLTIEFNSFENKKLIKNYHFDQEDHLYDIDVKKQGIILLFKSDKRIYKWERKLIFDVRKIKIEDGEYDEVYRLKLVKDSAIAEKRLAPQKLNVHKTNKDFGDVFLSEYSNFNFKEASSNFTWPQILKTIKPDSNLDLENEIEENTFNFLENIEDDTVIKLESGIYNFSIPRNYLRQITEEKFVKIENGHLEISGFSNLKIIGKDEVLFVTEEPDFPILELTKCKDITLKNIEAVHAIEETFCDASVFRIEASEKINFNNCIADGSGRYGFDIFDSNTINISDSIIQNCSEAAVYYSNNKSIVLDNVKIINNTLGEVFMSHHSCSSRDDNSIMIINSLIEKNEMNFIAKCPKDLFFSNATIHLNKNDKFTTFDKERLIQLKNTKLIHNE